MVYYLPASEHEMRKFLPLPVSSKALTAQQVEANFLSLRISYAARNILFCTWPPISSPTGGALNVVV
jgi:hypothetical protein